MPSSLTTDHAERILREAGIAIQSISHWPIATGDWFNNPDCPTSRPDEVHVFDGVKAARTLASLGTHVVWGNEGTLQGTTFLHFAVPFMGVVVTGCAYKWEVEAHLEVAA